MILSDKPRTPTLGGIGLLESRVEALGYLLSLLMYREYANLMLGFAISAVEISERSMHRSAQPTQAVLRFDIYVLAK